MSRYDVRWLWRHPVEWAAIMWMPIVLAVMLGAKAIVVGEPVYNVLQGSGLWPVVLAFCGGMMLVATVAPLDPRVQSVAGGTLLAVATLRMVTYLWAWATASLGHDGRAIALGLALHWLVIAVLAVQLPVLLEASGRRMTVEAGRDDRGRR